MFSFGQAVKGLDIYTYLNLPLFYAVERFFNMFLLTANYLLHSHLPFLGSHDTTMQGAQQTHRPIRTPQARATDLDRPYLLYWGSLFWRTGLVVGHGAPYFLLALCECSSAPLAISRQ